MGLGPRLGIALEHGDSIEVLGQRCCSAQPRDASSHDDGVTHQSTSWGQSSRGQPAWLIEKIALLALSWRNSAELELMTTSTESRDVRVCTGTAKTSISDV